MLNLAGKRFCKLLVLNRSKEKSNRTYLWNCLCDCGKTTLIRGSYLVSGHTKSCGCYKFETKNATHGKSKSSTYNIWCSMKQRCNDKNHKYYASYGGRGITVCTRWHKFENFIDDMGEKPKGMTIDRINNSLGYFKDNCRWATRKEQARNTRRNKYFTINGRTQCLQAWVNECDIPYKTVHNRLKRGVNIEDALRPVEV